MKEELLSITELAKLRRVTSETLRHYDRINLMKPTYVDPETRYRYYSIRQYEKLGTILELRQLGMSIDDIANYFDNRNLFKSAQILVKHHKLLGKRIAEQQLIHDALLRKLNFLNEIKNLDEVNVVFEKDFNKRHMITFDQPAGGPREHAYAFTRLERYLNEMAPILASDRVGVYSDENILKISDDYVSAYPMLFVEEDAIESEYKREVPAGRYICMYYHDGELERYNSSFETLKDYMKEQELCVNGPIFQIYKIDKTLTSDAAETLMEIQIPIIKRDLL